jgi:hypothetical protein
MAVVFRPVPPGARQATLITGNYLIHAQCSGKQAHSEGGVQDRILVLSFAWEQKAFTKNSKLKTQNSKLRTIIRRKFLQPVIQRTEGAVDMPVNLLI